MKKLIITAILILILTLPAVAQEYSYYVEIECPASVESNLCGIMARNISELAQVIVAIQLQDMLLINIYKLEIIYRGETI